MATTARDVMTDDCTCVSAADTVLDAARRLAESGVGSLPICGEDDRLKGMISDRDIVVKILAEGKDPSTCTVGDLAQGEAVTIGADDDISEAISTMVEHRVRRLPVIDGHELVGVVAQADIARECSSEDAGRLLAGLSS